MLKLFAYGTLKRGFGNHDRFCRGFLTVEDAVVRGRLFEAFSGIPVLQVPEEDILAVGTVDPLADVATQAHHAACMSHSQPTHHQRGEDPQTSPWGPVYGELFTFDDPETRLPAMDRLEGFHPGSPSLYRRVLVAVQVRTTLLPAWLYVVGESWPDTLTEIPGGVWR